MKQLLVMVLLLLFGADGYAQDYEAESLRGLTGVQVIVESLQPDIEADGLPAGAIQRDVEMKLRAAGIRVLTQEERLKEPGMPYLYVRVASTKRDEIELYSYYIELYLMQTAILFRNPSILSQHATTWKSTGVIGSIGSRHVDNLRQDINVSVDEFIAAHRSVNPR